MQKGMMKRVTVLMLPIIVFLLLVSFSYALDIFATVTIIPVEEINIKIILPENTTYYTRGDNTSIILLFKVAKPASWMGYSLDDSPIKEVKFRTKFIGMEFINDLSPGTHKIQVYVKNTLGYVGSSEVIFTIKKTTYAKNSGHFNFFDFI